MESFTEILTMGHPRGKEGPRACKKGLKVTARDGHGSEMIHDHSKSAVKLLEPCKYPKTAPDTISDGDR